MGFNWNFFHSTPHLNELKKSIMSCLSSLVLTFSLRGAGFDLWVGFFSRQHLDICFTRASSISNCFLQVGQINILNSSFLTFYKYYIIFFYKNQERFFKAVFNQVNRKPASCAITLRVRRAHRTAHYRMAASKPTFEVFSEIYLLVPSKSTLTYGCGPPCRPETFSFRDWCAEPLHQTAWLGW